MLRGEIVNVDLGFLKVFHKLKLYCLLKLLIYEDVLILLSSTECHRESRAKASFEKQRLGSILRDEA